MSKAVGTYALHALFYALMLTYCCSTVPTKDQVLIPESLLKKRKTQEKTQAEREAQRAEEKKVLSPTNPLGKKAWRR